MRRTVGRLCAAILFVLLLPSLFACSRERVLEYCELSITLPAEFELITKEEELVSLASDAAATDGSLTVTLARLSFVAAIEDGIPDTLGPEAFAKVFATRSGLKLEGDATATVGDITVRISEWGDAVYYTYGYLGAEELPMRAVIAFYRTPYAYFAIGFYAPYYGEWGIEAMLSLTSSVSVNVQG